MIHSGIQGQLDEVSRSMWVCPWGHLCIFLGNTQFWKVAWFSLPLKGLGSGILRFGVRVPSLSLISCVTLGKFASLSSSFPYVQEKIIGIWRPRRMAEVKD